MRSVFLSVQKTLAVKGANTFDHVVFTSHIILVVFCVQFGEINCFSCVELLKISWFGYFIQKPSKVWVLLKNEHMRRGANTFSHACILISERYVCVLISDVSMWWTLTLLYKLFINQMSISEWNWSDHQERIPNKSTTLQLSGWI